VGEKKERRTLRKSVLVAFGIVCVVLAFGLIGALAHYAPVVNDKDEAISMLDSHVSNSPTTVASLPSNVTNSQDQVKLVWNGSVPEIITTVDLSMWLNNTVVVEGNLTGPYDGWIPEADIPPYNCWLYTPNGTIGVLWNNGPIYPIDSKKATVYGVVRIGKVQSMWWPRHGIDLYGRPVPDWKVYYIEATKVEFTT